MDQSTLGTQDQELALFFSFGSVTGLPDSWFGNNTQVCTWEGVTCLNDVYITEIHLNGSVFFSIFFFFTFYFSNLKKKETKIKKNIKK